MTVAEVNAAQFQKGGGAGGGGSHLQAGAGGKNLGRGQ